MRRLAWALCLSMLLTFQAGLAEGGNTLESQVQQITGISRTVNTYLQSVAAVRVMEIQAVFAHRPMPELAQWHWGEVIAVNNASDYIAYAVNQWKGSPSHWTILSNPGYNHIGCAVDQNGTKFYAVCLFGKLGTVSQPPPQTPIVPTIPDTHM